MHLFCTSLLGFQYAYLIYLLYLKIQSNNSTIGKLIWISKWISQSNIQHVNYVSTGPGSI